MTQEQLDRIKAARDRNRAALEAENAAKAAEAARMADFEKRVEENFHASMAQAAGLVLSCPGRPLPARTVAQLKEIRLRNEILAEVARLTR